jgi:hypothetical protein
LFVPRQQPTIALVRFETADTATHTRIGEGLTRIARDTGWLETGHPVGKYALRHDESCADCGRAVEADEAFSLDTESGALYCATDGAARRGEE